MKTRSWATATSLLILILQLTSAAQPVAPATAPALGRGPAGPAQSATQPVLQSAVRHANFLERAKQGNIDVLFTGDSITDFFYYGNRNNALLNGRPVWDKYFGSMNAADFAVSGAKTQNLVYQFQNGELDGFKAKLVIMMIGTNNLSSRNTVDETVDGINAVIHEIQQRQPQAKLLLLGIFPRGATPAERLRASIKQVNDILAKLNDGQHIFYMDIGDKFLEPDGSISTEMMPDALHPTAKGYEIWAQAILPKVKELMGEK